MDLTLSFFKSSVKFSLPIAFDVHMIIPPSSELLNPFDWFPSHRLPQSELMSPITSSTAIIVPKTSSTHSSGICLRPFQDSNLKWLTIHRLISRSSGFFFPSLASLLPVPFPPVSFSFPFHSSSGGSSSFPSSSLYTWALSKTSVFQKRRKCKGAISAPFIFPSFFHLSLLFSIRGTLPQDFPIVFLYHLLGDFSCFFTHFSFIPLPNLFPFLLLFIDHFSFIFPLQKTRQPKMKTILIIISKLYDMVFIFLKTPKGDPLIYIHFHLETLPLWRINPWSIFYNWVLSPSSNVLHTNVGPHFFPTSRPFHRPFFNHFSPSKNKATKTSNHTCYS